MTNPMSGIFRGFDIASTGLRAELQRSEIVASNLGNMHRTGNAEKLPYRRKVVVFEEALNQAKEAGVGKSDTGVGVAISRVAEDSTPFPVFYQPGHPDADAKGQVMSSNVDMFKELVDMNIIQRSFDANLKALKSYRGMLQNTLQQLGG